MEQRTGLIFAFVLDGQGGGRSLDWAGVRAWQPTDGVLWLHVDRTHPTTVAWLEDEAGLEPLVVDALTAEESRPRASRVGDALVVNLRGVNLNPGADPEDMVSVRLWIEARRVISCRMRRVLAVNDLREALEHGEGPVDAGDVLARLGMGLIERMSPVIDELADAVDRLEEDVGGETDEAFRAALGETRRQLIALYRYLHPQRDVLRQLQGEGVSWLDADHRLHLHENADRSTRLVEELTAARERTVVVQDEFQSNLSFRINRTMYLLTVVATVLLPLSFVTGLLGINVGGIPGAENPLAFAIVVVLLALLVVLEVVVLRRLKWI